MTLEAIDRRRQHAWTQRAKLLIQMLTTSAYGSIAVALADTVLKGAAFGAGQLATLCFGLVAAFVAYYLAPEGERYGSA